MLAADALIMDIETDIVDDKLFKDLGAGAPNKIEVVCFKEGILDLTSVVRNADTLDAYLDIARPKRVVFHNGIRFDVPVLKRLWKIGFHPDTEVFDTMLAAKIVWPNRDSYSLESFAKEFGMKKLDLSNLEERCRSDVEITDKLYKKLIKEIEAQDLPYQIFQVEFQVAKLVADQCRLGVRFDKQKAIELADTMLTEMDRIRKEVHYRSSSFLIKEKDLALPPKRQFNKDGSLTPALWNYLDKQTESWYMVRKVGETAAPMSVIVMAKEDTSVPRVLDLPLTGPINTTKKLEVNKLAEVKEYLISKGWRPTLWNRDKAGKATSPKLYDEKKRLCPNLEAMAKRHSIINIIANYYSTRNRRSILLSDNGKTGWLNNERLAIDGKLCPDADTLGAATARFTHKIVANVPRVTSPYGKEFRSLFLPPEEMQLVGWDATALEAVMEAHYTYPFDDGKYAAELLSGDIHTKNMREVGLKTRDDAKTFKYAITYGAQPRKLATTFGWSVPEATERFEAFWAANPSLQQLTNAVQEAAKRRGYIVTIDRRRIPVDSPHTSLNRLLQSAGAITMKYAMILSERMIRKQGATEEDAYGVIKYHDEEQWAAKPEWAPTVLECGTKSVHLAGKYLKLKVPLYATGKIGNSWADTH